MIRRFLRGDETLYNLLEASAQGASDCITLLKNLIPNLGGDYSEQLEIIREARREHKKISQNITETLCRTFITPLDREDIEALSDSLNKIPKTIEKIAERLTICPVSLTEDFAIRQIALLDKGAREVLHMVNGLRKKESLDVVQKRQDHLQRIEGEGDTLLFELLAQLYKRKDAAMEIVILKDLYELLEKAIDRCRDCGNVVFQVVLKYS